MPMCPMASFSQFPKPNVHILATSHGLQYFHNKQLDVGKSHIFYDFGKDSTFKKFIVESGSTTLKTVDDILYTYDGTRLISIPRGKTFTNNTYIIPEGITFMNELSFSRNKNIDTIVLPNSYEIIRYIDKNNNSYGFINTGNSLSVAIYL